MKTIQQVLGFVQGWQLAIKSNEAEQNDDNAVFQALLTIESYIKDDS
jgi:hypothetical protein